MIELTARPDTLPARGHSEKLNRRPLRKWNGLAPARSGIEMEWLSIIIAAVLKALGEMMKRFGVKAVVVFRE